jgi:hypothetical protein
MKDKFIGYMKEEVTAAYSNNPKESPDFQLSMLKIGTD